MRQRILRNAGNMREHVDCIRRVHDRTAGDDLPEARRWVAVAASTHALK
jgi:hypothetical protein